jgi:acetylornithine deacetylase/succinyl-diaminopimelate desuccinylase-like protein
VRLSIRIPPTLSAAKAATILKEILEENEPESAMVEFKVVNHADGWDSPPLQPWLQGSVDNASMNYFGQASVAWGEGGTIPFMGMLGAKFPNAQFVITGVLGPESNAHGPNEFLHIPTAIKLTACVAHIIADMAQQ